MGRRKALHTSILQAIGFSSQQGLLGTRPGFLQTALIGHLEMRRSLGTFGP
jgi:hypothetical protein